MDAGEAASLDSWWAGDGPTPGGARRGGARARARAAAALAVALAACGAAATSADVPARGPLRGAWPADWDEQRIEQFLAPRFPLSDLSQRSVALAALRRGAARDAIAAILDPSVEALADADGWLAGTEPVVALEIGGEARAYPLQVLTWHELVNDTLSGASVLVSYCPLCNTAITFERSVRGQPRTFGVSGLLRHSDLVMYDHTTESFWEQATGKAIAGRETGERLRFLPSPIVSYRDFKATFPHGTVLARQGGGTRAVLEPIELGNDTVFQWVEVAPEPGEFSWDYGFTPYSEYDEPGSEPWYETDSPPDGRLEPKARVLGLEHGDRAVAVPFAVLEERRVVALDLAGQSIVVLWQPGTSSALDAAELASGRDVGAAAAYVPSLDGRALTFEAREGALVDGETGSTWSVLGAATAGPLAGSRLTPVVARDALWFAWSSFYPTTELVAR